jgi:hypothetical protein
VAKFWLAPFNPFRITTGSTVTMYGEELADPETSALGRVGAVVGTA